MSPLMNNNCTSNTTPVVPVSVATTTPFNEFVKQHSMLTNTTVETSTTTTSSSTSNSIATSTNTIESDRINSLSSASNTSTTACSSSHDMNEVVVHTTENHSPEPKEQQQPCRNLSKAFDALCISPEETVKEEKMDTFDDMILKHHHDNSNNIVSPISVVMNESIADNHSTSNDIAQVRRNMNVVEECHPNALLNSTTIPVQQPSPSLLATTTVLAVPELGLHPDLQLKLSVYTVQRVAHYSIIHDINKEAATMAAHDPLQSPESESVSPLVMEGRGQQQSLHTRTSSLTNVETPSSVEYAVIDEEKWLLGSIANRSSQETATNTSTQCPATFLQAMGEKEYDVLIPSSTTASNAAAATTTTTTNSLSTRTQLWKPSRSWWEAKSGKNPWIEPASHNKRWRYLWPLIHYHKFVHKCIKKLKRNGVDVKISVSPVSVFLREEVCAVSDHLATVSLFGSEEWMDCIQHFNGWTDMETTESIQQYQLFVQTLPLRSLQEPIDVDSPLLRNQIDEAFLRTIAYQREMANVLHNPQSTSSVASSSKLTRNQPGNTTTTATNTTGTATMNAGPPPMYSHMMTHHHQLQQQQNQLPVPKQINGVRRSRYFANGWYPPGHYPPGWENLPIDASSVHSELSANSYPQPPPIHQHHSYIDTATVAAQAAHYHMYPHPPTGVTTYYHHHPHHGMVPSPGHSIMSMGRVAPSEASHSTDYTYPDQYGGWMDPTMAAYAMNPQYYPTTSHYYNVVDASTMYPSPHASTSKQPPDTSESEGTVEEEEGNESSKETPYKYNMDQSYIMQSPNWAHLDQATLAMGLATPAMISPATTPRRILESDDGGAVTTTAAKNKSLLQAGNSVTEDETSITMTENEDEYLIAEVNPYGAPIYPGQQQPYHTSKNIATMAPPHVNYYPTYDHHHSMATTSRTVVPPSPATQFMMSPQASFAYNYGYGISPARIVPHRRPMTVNTNRQRSGSSSTTTNSNNTSESKPNVITNNTVVSTITTGTGATTATTLVNDDAVVIESNKNIIVESI
jgi:hypothetical protein